MTTYKTIVELPAVELEVLNGMMEHVTPMTIENLRLIEDACEVSWAYQKVNEDIGILDRYITAEFDNGMLMDVCFYGEVGETNGVYLGIGFGDKDNVFVEPGEYTENCYPIEEGSECMVDGFYSMYYNGDVYEVEIRAVK